MTYRIALVNNQAQLGGAETVMGQLRAGALRAGHDVSVHVADGKDYPDHIEPLYPRWLSKLNHSRLHRPVECLFPRASWTDQRFRRLAAHSCDLIHLHNFHGKYATIESLAWLASRKPLLWTFHALWGVTGGCDHPRDCLGYAQGCGACPQTGLWPIGPEDNTAAQLELKVRLLGPLPLHVAAPSRHVAQTILSSRVGRNWTVHHIPNGVDPARFDPEKKGDRELRGRLGLHPEGPIILVVNRNFQDPHKGGDLLLTALGALRGGPIQIILIGHNSAWAASRLSRPCLALGYIADPRALASFYEAADFFLFASPAETFPCVILEAMAAGCCVISTPTNGVLEQITHARSGWLSRAISGQALAAALQEALAQPDRGRACGRAARAAVQERFSEQGMIDRYLKLYADIIEERGCASALTSRLTTALAH